MRFLFLLSLIAVLITGCASSEKQADGTAPDARPVSTIPWNRPQSWEGGGALGGAMGK